MGRGSGAFGFIIIFTLYLLIQGVCTAEYNKINANSNNVISGAINVTIAGTLNGTVNNTVDNIINETTDEKQPPSWILLIPAFFGSLLFLSWMCRFFDRMNFCFIIFILAALLLFLLLSFDNFLQALNYTSIESNPASGLNFSSGPSSTSGEFNYIAGKTGYFLYLSIIFILIISIIIVFLYEIFWKERNKSETNLIMSLHDILRNFIIICTCIMWPLIALYFYQNEMAYITFHGAERLSFPVYIITASFLGILSYLLLSIEETFCQLIPEYRKISIAWSYIRRIIIAPFIAITGFYLLNYLQNIGKIEDVNNYFVFVFSFLAGVFTKTIEEWIYAWVQKLLPGDKKVEFETRDEYQVKESEFVKKLRFDEDLAYALYSAKIRTIEELATYEDADNLLKKVNFDTRNLGEGTGCLLRMEKEKDRFGNYSKQQVEMYIGRARTYMNIDKSELVTKLNIDRDLAFKLYYFGNIKTLEDLKNCDPQEVHKRICDCKKKVEELTKDGNVEIEDAHRAICDCSEQKIKELKEKAHAELELEKKELLSGRRVESSQDKEKEELPSGKQIESSQDKEGEEPKEV